jgi:hypothetical protein
MTDQLREAFHDLAETTHEGAGSLPAPGAHDLWTRGRRARRRQITSSVVVAGAVLALVGAVAPTVTEQLGTTPLPASYDEADLAVPDRIWTPSSWAPEAGADNPPGPLALIGLASRRSPWLATRSGAWFGVSAVDQTYRWLDLPGQATSEDAQAISLSPDGTRLAYALGGEPSEPDPQSDVVGFAVLDLVTGEVTERVHETRFGLRSDERLVWSGDSQWLMIGWAQYRKMRGLRDIAEFEAWNPSTGALTPLGRLDAYQGMGSSPTGVAAWLEHSLLEVDPATGDMRRHEVDWWWEDDVDSDAPFYNPDGSFVAWRDGRRWEKGPRKGGTFPAVYAATVTHGGELGRPLRLDNTLYVNAVLGWTASRTLLVEAWWPDRPEEMEEPPRRIVAVDVPTGEVRPGIQRPGTYDELRETQLATALLIRPLVQADRPGRHPPLGATAAVGVLALALAIAWVRRARSRREDRVLAEGSDT